ncbi:class I SAM-dependent methyltransferase [Bacillus salipaludis]|uniref:Methyltransferase domain-containing protein n=1 Tax=Bacillus salipaludis TaxID=2547811 RepID=A0AA90QTF9_9BACI|nr:methyltransferase domain-containing protein [Bacillus salipaludis]MDQ6597917.1 methyltransferase domain-containing protein [Bacillus salipaludis]
MNENINHDCHLLQAKTAIVVRNGIEKEVPLDKMDNKEMMKSLDMPERKEALPPEKLLQLLPIKEKDILLDLGAGTGYFSIPAAKMTKGTVYALDLEPEMLAELQSRIDLQGSVNIQLIEGSIEDIPLSFDTIDGVIASLVLHYVNPVSRVLNKIRRVLKPGGYLLCFEWEKKESSLGPPLHKRISSSDMEKAIVESGLTIIKRVFPKDFLYIFIAKKMTLINSNLNPTKGKHLVSYHIRTEQGVDIVVYVDHKLGATIEFWLEEDRKVAEI